MAETKTWALWRDGKVNPEEAKVLRRRASEVPVPYNDAARKDIKTVVDSFCRETTPSVSPRLR